MQAQIVAAPFHVRGGERHAERRRAATGRSLKKICSCRFLVPVDTRTRGGSESRERDRRASCPCRCPLRRAVTPPSANTSRDTRAPSRAGRRAARSRAARGPAGRRARTRRRRAALRPCAASGYSGNFRHSRLDLDPYHAAARASSSGAASARAINPAIAPFRLRASRGVVIGRRADADAACHHRRILIERDGVLVDRDAGLAERRLGHLAGHALREHVDQHQVIVGAAADQPEAGRRQRRGEPLRRWRRSAAGTRRTPAPALP